MLRNRAPSGGSPARSTPVRASLLIVPLFALLLVSTVPADESAVPLVSAQGITLSSPGGAALAPSAAGADRTPAPESPRAAFAESGPDTDEANLLPAASIEDVPPPPASAAGWIFEAPSLGVRASTAAFGLDAAGVMQVPTDAVTVAWYRFTAVPGAAGNAVLAAHVDWAGQLGVFNRIDELTAGDRIRLVPASGHPIVYVVESTELVDPVAADVDAIIGSREGAPTLTLITCGGPFNTTTRDYEQRVIVRAVLADVEA